MPEDSRKQDHLRGIRDLAAWVLSEWDYYDDPDKMVVPISQAFYPDLQVAIEALRAAMDAMVLEHPELIPPHRYYSTRKP